MKKTQKIRRSSPKQLGGREPKEKSQSLHEVRALTSLVDKNLMGIGLGTFASVPSVVLLAVKDWLMDWEHHYRMTNRPDDQDVVNELIQHLRKGDL